MVNAARTQKDWLQRIVARMNRASSKLREPEWLEGKWPKWVTNIARELSKTMYSTAKLDGARQWAPGEVGAVLGQQFAYLAALAMMVEEWASKYESQLKTLVVAPKDKKRAKEFERQSEEFARDVSRALRFALTLAIEQDYYDAAKFFAAFGKGIQRKPTTGSDIGRTNTSIYIFLIKAWRSVEKLASVRELHTALCRQFGTHVVGDLKRVEKMCQRIELRFAGPGRPKKAKTQTI